jgi:hypothetical protein
MTITDTPAGVDALTARVAALEARLAAPAPQAAPPITIGPFNNVPAPGSPIRSDWTQSISSYVADKVAKLVGFTQFAPGAQSIGAAFTDVAGTAVAFTAVAGHRYRVQAIACVNLSTGPGVVNLALVSGASTIMTSQGATLVVGAYAMVPIAYVAAPAAGAVTYKLQAKAPAGGLVTFNDRVYFEVLDLGT